MKTVIPLKSQGWRNSTDGCSAPACSRAGRPKAPTRGWVPDRWLRPTCAHRLPELYLCFQQVCTELVSPPAPREIPPLFARSISPRRPGEAGPCPSPRKISAAATENTAKRGKPEKTEHQHPGKALGRTSPRISLSKAKYWLAGGCPASPAPSWLSPTAGTHPTPPSQGGI